jgi:DNA helicase-2/ATP-dependent DNA helicase PcrA
MLPTMAVWKSGSRELALDEPQRSAIEHVHGPLLVVAGAGTGKTTVLTRRIARLIGQGHARPGEVLALTYTDNAAREMRDRVQAELRGTNLTGLRACTFHAYGNQLLHECGRGFGVLDDKDLWIYLRQRIRDLHLNYFVRAANVAQFLDDLLDFIRRCQDDLVGPENYAEYVDRLERRELPIPRVTASGEADAVSEAEILERCREISCVYTAVEGMLCADNLGTFGHMIVRAHRLLLADPELLARERQRARFLLVDEFQDANFAQVRILSALAGEERNVFAVGDPDQAIYRFRGASSAAFALFLRHFPASAAVVLEKNQRSTTPILECAFKLIDKNPPVFTGKGKADPGGLDGRRRPLESAREQRAREQGTRLASPPVEVVSLLRRDDEAEAADLVEVIEEKRRQLRCRWSDFAVLYRLHIHRDQVASKLGQKGIPFSIENLDVMDTPEARDLLACLGAVHSTADAASLLRVAALPQFGVDAEEFRSALRSAPREDPDRTTLARLLERIKGGPLVLATLRQTREAIARSAAKSHAALQLIVRSFGFDSASAPLQALQEFVKKWEEKALTQTGDVGELLDYLEHFREARGTIPLPSRDGEDAVRLMTVHAAKGLEFPHVFIIRANPGSFPGQYKEPLVAFPPELRHPDSVSEADSKCLHDQEERRLFYVAMTRARDSLTIYAKQGSGKTDKTPAGLLRDVLKDPSLRRWLRQRKAREFQTELFAQPTPPPPAASRTVEWLSRPPLFPLTHLSATAVERYQTCPLQFKLEREWKIPTQVPAAMQYGAAMHRVLRTYFDAVRQGRALSEDQLIELFRADLRQGALDDRYQHELYERQGIQQLRDFLALARGSPAPRVLHTEEVFEVRIGTATVVGRIDRIDDLGDGRVAIVDYKTGKPRSQEDADRSLQLSIYALAAKEKWGYEADSLVFYNLEENSSISTSRGRMHLEEARATVQEVAAQIQDGQFEPRTGYHCRFCSYRNLCFATEKRILTATTAKIGRS